MTPPLTSERIWSRVFVIVFAAAFLHELAFSMMINLPGYFAQLGASEGQIGLVFSVAGIASFASRPIVGRWLDLVGRKPILLVSAGVNGVALLLFLTVDAYGWWMFTTIAAPGTRPTDELFLFHADSPLGPWEPHLRNPVKSNVRGSRPAGAIFEWQGRNYRPAQDCSIRYGHGIVLQRIRRIDPEVYEEEEVGEILPEWEPGLLGVHTVNFGDGLSVIDCLRKRRR